MPNKLNLMNQRFGRLVVISEHKNKGKKTQWVCICDCGQKCIVKTGQLRSMKTESCGCLRKENAVKNGKKMWTTHSMNKSPEHRSYHAMLARCYRKTHKSYYDYGGRGIKVCDRWRNSFENFFEDIGKRPSKKHSLGRIDNNSDYMPDNCKWETVIEQANNKRNNFIIEVDGIEKTLPEWCKTYNIDYHQVYTRIINKGWTPKKALKTPIGFKMKKYKVNGETKTLRQWAKAYNICYSTLKYRINAGWDIHKALTTPVRHRKK